MHTPRYAARVAYIRSMALQQLQLQQLLVCLLAGASSSKARGAELEQLDMSPPAMLVWPAPAHAELASGPAVTLSPKFSIAVAPISSPGSAEAMALLSSASQRYAARIRGSGPLVTQSLVRSSADVPLAELTLTVSSANATLTQGVDESYELSVSATAAMLRAPTVFGALRGLETFAQLVSSSHTVPQITVDDAPRFPYRGILVDTARHFINISRLQQIIDAMEMQKLNVLQLHLTDDQSFPFQSLTHPNITKYGAFDNSSIYTHSDIKSLASYAKQRGVWIQLELDLPAHAASWKGQYNFAWCSTKLGTPSVPGSGLPNPTLSSTFSTLHDLYTELAPLVQSGSIASTIHLGGDEVERNCWTNDPKVQDWADANGYKNDLQAWDCGRGNHTICSTECSFHVQQAKAAIAAGFGSLYAWEDARGCGALLDLDPNTIIDVWDQGAPGQWLGGLQDAVARGFQIVVSSGCYFLEYPPPWAKVWGWRENYACDIQNVTGITSSQKSKIIGGHASRWGETTTGENWFDHVFPSLLGVAEKLWSPAELTVPSADHLAMREPASRAILCKMKGRGLGPMNVGTYNPLNGSYGPWPAGFCA